jgi:hypothetical protein
VSSEDLGWWICTSDPGLLAAQKLTNHPKAPKGPEVTTLSAQFDSLPFGYVPVGLSCLLNSHIFIIFFFKAKPN